MQWNRKKRDVRGRDDSCRVMTPAAKFIFLSISRKSKVSFMYNSTSGHEISFEMSTVRSRLV